MTDERSNAELGPALGAWLGFAALAVVGTVGIVIAYPAGGWAQTSAAVAAIVLTQVVYAVAARPRAGRIRDSARGSWVFAVVAVVLFAVAVSLNRWSSLSLFALTPQIFLAFSFGYAALLITLLNVASAAAQIALEASTLADVVQIIGVSLFIVVFSLFFGSRIVAIAERSAERLQLISALREREADVAALSAARGAEQERTRIAREMHDTLAQGFTSIITLGHAASASATTDAGETQRLIGLMTRTAQENLAESRRIIAALSPGRLDGTTLAEAVTRTVAAFAEETGVDAVADIAGEPLSSAPAAEVVALRAVQEGLSNVRRHADAGRVDVGLRFTERDLVLSVRDDGVGFDDTRPSDGFGLPGIRARVAEVGGTVQIASTPGEGTVVMVTIPRGELP